MSKKQPTKAKRLAFRAIQARLVAQDSSFRQFALERGYEPRTVTQVVTRWAGEKDMPRGRLSFRILLDLSRTIGKEVIPGILKEAAEEAA
uniref:Uncharacterized protein n=1 Tax=Marinobacter nauticus TaxID=2743 RepID=A0A455W6S9_MARNT|nr:hypothetical protein YBY_30230 [Marinobacter nauticus]